MSDAKEQLDFLRFKALKGAEEAGYPMTVPYLTRMDGELSIIDKTGFAPYFLIVADLARFMRENKIKFNPRGSGCGSVVVWYLRISHPWSDPVKYDIPFERFLNPERVSNPDIDIDIDDTRRHEVVQYTINRYGQDRVARIVTFGTLGAKSAIMDIARALNIPDYQTVGAEISAHIPSGKGDDGKNHRLADVIAKSEFLQDKRRQFPELFHYAMKCEGKPRHASIHAAGTIIAPDSMTKFVPLLFQGSPENRKPEDWFPTTQWDMYDCEDRGLLKMDYLGLKTLRVIDLTEKRINRIRKSKKRPSDFDIDKVPQNDEKTWDLLAAGKLAGIFQVERQFVRNFAKRMNLAQVRDIWQLAVLVAIIRPGMMDTGMTEEYLLRAGGKSAPTPPHPWCEEILRKNYGCLVFQEDIMSVVQALADYKKSQADNLRRIIGKKKVSDMLKERPKFIEKAVKKGVAEGDAVRVWDLMEAFGRYGFNNAHALAYAIIAYQTAYLKTHHTLAYMTELVNSEAGVSDKDQGYNFKVAEYIEESRSMGIKILPPCVQRSMALCSNHTPFENEMRFGLSLIKRVSGGAVDWILNHPGATSLKEFILGCYEHRPIESIDKTDNHDTGVRVVEKKVEWRSYCMVGKTDLEALTAAGAFDCFDKDRARTKAMLPKLTSLAAKYHEQQGKQKNGKKTRLTPEQVLGEFNDFRIEDGEYQETTLEERLDEERSVTGCYLSMSPFVPFEATIQQHETCTPADIIENNWPDGPMVFPAIVSDYREIVVKQGKNRGRAMAIFTFKGKAGDIDAPAFSNTWDTIKKQQTEIHRHKCYLVHVKPDMNGKGVIVEQMWLLSRT